MSRSSSDCQLLSCFLSPSALCLSLDEESLRGPGSMGLGLGPLLRMRLGRPAQWVVGDFSGRVEDLQAPE